MGRPDHRDASTSDRELVLAAALAEFAECGVEQADEDAIRRRAGVDRLPAEFAERSALLRSVIDRFLTVRPAAAEANLTLDVPPGVFLPRVARAILGFYARPEAQIAQRLCVTEAPTLAKMGVGVVRERRENVFRMLADYFRLQIERGAVDDIDPDFAARAFLGLVWAHIESRYFLAFMTPSELSDEQFIDGVLPLLLDGLRARGRA